MGLGGWGWGGDKPVGTSVYPRLLRARGRGDGDDPYLRP